VFVAIAHALEDSRVDDLQRLLSLAAAEPEPAAHSGLVAAFGWVWASLLKGITKTLLGSAEPAHQAIGLAACAMHRVDPGVALTRAVQAPDSNSTHRPV
jgi:hypothetical protein